jgi:sugar O-acyltransferase (sialic acid O-acetyltransferase NeuD family)
MKEIILIGGGGHCKSVIDVIEQEGKFQIIGIVDKSELLDVKVLGYPVIGNDSDLADLSKKYRYALVTVGQIKSSSLRVRLFKLAVKVGLTMPNIISPRAYVSKHAMIGQGTVIMHDALVNANAKIGENCIINSKALIEHDVVIENHCHISTGSIINGGTVVKCHTFFGSNSVAKENIVIEKQSVIGGGVTVLK